MKPRMTWARLVTECARFHPGFLTKAIATIVLLLCLIHFIAADLGLSGLFSEERSMRLVYNSFITGQDDTSLFHGDFANEISPSRTYTDKELRDLISKPSDYESMVFGGLSALGFPKDTTIRPENTYESAKIFRIVKYNGCAFDELNKIGLPFYAIANRSKFDINIPIQNELRRSMERMTRPYMLLITYDMRNNKYKIAYSASCVSNGQLAYSVLIEIDLKPNMPACLIYGDAQDDSFSKFLQKKNNLSLRFSLFMNEEPEEQQNFLVLRLAKDKNLSRVMVLRRVKSKMSNIKVPLSGAYAKGWYGIWNMQGYLFDELDQARLRANSEEDTRNQDPFIWNDIAPWLLRHFFDFVVDKLDVVFFKGTPQELVKHHAPGLLKDKSWVDHYQTDTKAEGRRSLVMTAFLPEINGFPFVPMNGHGPAMAELTTNYFNYHSIPVISGMEDQRDTLLSLWRADRLLQSSVNLQPIEGNVRYGLQQSTWPEVIAYVNAERSVLHNSSLSRKENAPNNKEILDKVLSYIGEGKVVTAYMIGRKTQAVVIYAAEVDSVDPNQIFLKVYDPNFPKDLLVIRDYETEDELSIRPNYEIIVTIYPTITATQSSDGEASFGDSGYFSFSYGECSTPYYWSNRNAQLYFRTSEDLAESNFLKFIM